MLKRSYVKIENKNTPGSEEWIRLFDLCRYSANVFNLFAQRECVVRTLATTYSIKSWHIHLPFCKQSLIHVIPEFVYRIVSLLGGNKKKNIETIASQSRRRFYFVAFSSGINLIQQWILARNTVINSIAQIHNIYSSRWSQFYWKLLSQSGEKRTRIKWKESTQSSHNFV